MNIVSDEQWTEARNQLLTREKAFTREREALSAARRALPLRKVDEPYRFEGALASLELAQLFAGQSQLIVYHYMFAPDSAQGCKNCAFVADHFDGTLSHLLARDTQLVAVSRAPHAKLAAMKERMGWQFPWYASADFNPDFQDRFSEWPCARNGDMPGFSVFLRQGDAVLHSYSTFSRGIDQLINSYNLLDLTPWGRHEEAANPMSWVRHHDRYAHTG
jgi:predicted dithiol-disulfide oxidoreductase (DUF899 family)